METPVNQSERSARKFLYKATAVTKSLHLEHPQSNVSVFASSDGHIIFLSHPRGKVFAQQKQIHAMFHLGDGQTRYFELPDKMWLDLTRNCY